MQARENGGTPLLWWDDRLGLLTGRPDALLMLAGSTWESCGPLPPTAVVLAPVEKTERITFHSRGEPAGRKPVEQFQVEVSATLADGKPCPSPVGPFNTRDAAWAWWFQFGQPGCDPKWSQEVGVSPVYLPWRAA